MLLCRRRTNWVRWMKRFVKIKLTGGIRGKFRAEIVVGFYAEEMNLFSSACSQTKLDNFFFSLVTSQVRLDLYPKVVQIKINWMRRQQIINKIKTFAYKKVSWTFKLDRSNSSREMVLQKLQREWYVNA